MDVGTKRSRKTEEEKSGDKVNRPDRKKSVAFADANMKEAFEKLREGKFEDKEFLQRAIEDLRSNPFCGIRIPSKLWPKEYVQKYNIDNLFKYNLPNAWRLMYSLRGSEIEIISIILEWTDHKEYERKFKY